jgi:hypothetical protein
VVEKEATTNRLAAIAVAAGVLGIVAAFIAYWLVLPAVLFGLAAVVLGVLSRRRQRGDAATVAITLGLVAMLAVPAFVAATDSAEKWARDCALDPAHDPNC